MLTRSSSVNESLAKQMSTSTPFSRPYRICGPDAATCSERRWMAIVRVKVALDSGREIGYTYNVIHICGKRPRRGTNGYIQERWVQMRWRRSSRTREAASASVSNESIYVLAKFSVCCICQVTRTQVLIRPCKCNQEAIVC